jgi:hypothetical protein
MKVEQISRWEGDVVMKIDDSQKAEMPDPVLGDNQTYSKGKELA